MADKVKSMTELAQASASRDLLEAYGPAENQDELKEQAKRFTTSENLLKELLRPNNGAPRKAPAVKMSEAVHTADFRILFPKVVSDILQQPQEPTYIGQSLLSRTIQVDGARVMEFPTLGAIRAFELSDTQEPQEQDPSFSKNITEIKVRRFGLKLEVSQDVIDESQWDVVGLYTAAAGNAMRRKKEELIFNEYQTRAVTIFDNSDATKLTTGKRADGVTKNGTFDHMDLLDMMAALAANSYNPTDIILHPLAWSIWAKDPFLRFQLMYKGGVGQTIGQFSGTDDDMNASTYIPFGLNVVVSPFQTLTYNAMPAAAAASGATNANYTSITVVDRASSILILQRTPMGVTQWENPVRDIRNLAFHEKYGLALLNGGRSAVIAKNVRLDTNYQPLYTTRSVTAA